MSFKEFLAAVADSMASGLSAGGRWLIARVQNPRRLLQALASEEIVRLWLKQSAKLLWGTLLYNLFVLLILQPLLTKLFPPLSPWEYVTGFLSGRKRWTVGELLPYVGPGIWISGNALLFALMNRKLRRAQDTVDGERPRRS